MVSYVFKLLYRNQVIVKFSLWFCSIIHSGLKIDKVFAPQIRSSYKIMRM